MGIVEVVEVKVQDIYETLITIGFVAENLRTTVKFDCKEVFDEFPNAVVSLAVKPPVGDVYPAVVVRDGDFAVWSINDSDLVNEGMGEIQITFVVDAIVAKSYIGTILVRRSLVTNGEAPDPITEWITEANAVLGTIDGAVRRAENSAVSAETAQGKAEIAQGLAEEAQRGAETAQGLAESAQVGAETAQSLAENAQSLAESARDEAHGYAVDAYNEAERAEQAANTAGYMEVLIDENGHLIYIRTSQVDADFSIVDGHLILESV